MTGPGQRGLGQGCICPRLCCAILTEDHPRSLLVPWSPCPGPFQLKVWSQLQTREHPARRARCAAPFPALGLGRSTRSATCWALDRLWVRSRGFSSHLNNVDKHKDDGKPAIKPFGNCGQCPSPAEPAWCFAGPMPWLLEEQIW